MTPVDATSTSSGRQPNSRAAISAVDLDTLNPASPVQALAQPLLHTMTRARPSERSRFILDSSTGAACARLVVKTPAADARSSDTTSARSSCGEALMPASTPAALKPAGAVTPPSMLWTLTSAAAAALDMERLPCGRDVLHGVQIRHHGVLSALAEQRAGVAVRRDLFRQPGMRHDREAHVREVRRLMREHAQVIVAVAPGALAQLVDDPAAHARILAASRKRRAIGLPPPSGSAAQARRIPR